MKIKTNAKIQRAVDARQGSKITHLTALHICAVSFEDEPGGNTWGEIGVNAFALGVENGMTLALEYCEKEDALKSSQGGLPARFGIYVATQKTDEGEDRLYFIGVPESIVARLETVSATELVV